jgi:uncharacterized protein
MNLKLAFPWHRYALIGALARELAGRQGGVFGKTHVQKLVYFLQELFGGDSEYDFSLYTYGPFSANLAGDLDVADGLGVVSLEYLPQAGAYNIAPGPQLAKAETRASEYLARHQDAIRKVTREFGGLRARELELRATIVYADREARREGAPLEHGQLVERVHAIKPHFTRETVEQAVSEMQAHGFVLHP